MGLRIGTVTVMPMGRSKAQLLEHLDREHACVDGEALSLEQLRNFHRGLHFPSAGGPANDYHRHVGQEWCPACRGRSDFHSCQFGGSGTYRVNAGSMNRKPCLACADQARQHSCGLARLQRMLSF